MSVHLQGMTSRLIAWTTPNQMKTFIGSFRLPRRTSGDRREHVREHFTIENRDGHEIIVFEDATEQDYLALYEESEVMVPFFMKITGLTRRVFASREGIDHKFCVEAVVLTVSTRELRTDRRRAVAVGGGQPPTRQRRHSLRWLARSVVSGGIGRQVADSRGRPDAPRGPSTQLVESY